MTKEYELMKQAVGEVLDARRANESRHKEDHEFLEELRKERRLAAEREQRIRERNEKWKNSVIGAILISIAITILGGVGAWFIKLFNVVEASQ